MKFTYCKDANSKSWICPRYGVHISKKPGDNQLLFTVYITVSDKKDGVYDVVMPRFEVQGKTAADSVYKAGAIAEALVRELRKLPEDSPLSKIKKILSATATLLVRSGEAGASPGRTKPQILRP